jgi:hypothetical protein
MNQPRILETDVHERTEIDDVLHGALQFNAGLEVFKLEETLLEDRCGQF